MDNMNKDKPNILYCEIIEDNNTIINPSVMYTNIDTNVNEILDDDICFYKLDTDIIDNENNINHTCDTNTSASNTGDTNTHIDNIFALHVDYSENYSIKMLHHVCNYYNIPKNKVKKDELISRIIEYENNPENSYQVYNRKRYWHYIHELQQDDYFNKFVVF